MSLSKSKFWYSNNCLNFSKRAVNFIDLFAYPKSWTLGGQERMTNSPKLFRQEIGSTLTGVRLKTHEEFAAFMGHFEARQPHPMSPPIF